MLAVREPDAFGEVQGTAFVSSNRNEHEVDGGGYIYAVGSSNPPSDVHLRDSALSKLNSSRTSKHLLTAGILHVADSDYLPGGHGEFAIAFKTNQSGVRDRST